MIDSDSRYFALSGNMPIGGPSTWHVTDWDQRRTISVTMDGEQDDESLAVEYLGRHIDSISPDTYGVFISNSGEITARYTDPTRDQTYGVHYPPRLEGELPPNTKVVSRDQLEELDRLGPDADLVTHRLGSGNSAKKVVFKYYFLWQYANRLWTEMNVWMRLPAHRNIVPFDRVVLDELEGRIIGFTCEYIPGGTLEDNKARIFKLKWLRQLIDVVDELNLTHGIAHQDIAPRNLAIEEHLDDIMLIDFNYAARIDHVCPEEGEIYRKDRNDVKGVIFTAYEIITRDDALRSVTHEEQNLDSLKTEWVKHPEVKLDNEVAAYRELLREWQKKRTGTKTCETTQPINWPSRPRPPLKTIPSVEGTTSFTLEAWRETREEMPKRGKTMLRWERPAQKSLEKGKRLLATGQFLGT